MAKRTLEEWQAETRRRFALHDETARVNGASSKAAAATYQSWQYGLAAIVRLERS